MNQILAFYGSYGYLAWPLTFACLFVLGFLIERVNYYFLMKSTERQRQELNHILSACEPRPWVSPNLSQPASKGFNRDARRV